MLVFDETAVQSICFIGFGDGLFEHRRLSLVWIETTLWSEPTDAKDEYNWRYVHCFSTSFELGCSQFVSKTRMGADRSIGLFLCFIKLVLVIERVSS